MTKGILCIAAVSMLIILPNWLWNDSQVARVISAPLSLITDISEVPASKTGISLVFDLSGVLLDIDTKKAFDEMGIQNILPFMAEHKIGPLQVKKELLKKVYDILNTIQPTGNFVNAQDPYGNRLPGIMCDWQAGRKSNAELLVLVFGALEQHPEWFSGAIDRKMVELVLKKMFIPERLLSTVTVVPEGFAYVKKCKKQGHSLFVLSNWDAESFELLVAKFPELFMLFDGVLISGIAKHIKPEPEAYKPLVERACYLNEIVLFIDDQKENSDAATACGLHGIHYMPKSGFLGLGTRPDFTVIDDYLERLMKNGRVKKVAY